MIRRLMLAVSMCIFLFSTSDVYAQDQVPAIMKNIIQNGEMNGDGEKINKRKTGTRYPKMMNITTY